MITIEEVRSALRHVQDPDLKKDLVTLDMIQDITVNGLKVAFTVVLTTPACPLKDKIRQDCIDAVHRHVHPGAVVEPLMTANVTTVARHDRLPNVRNIIAVVSGRGGVGKSTVAANLAVALAQTGAKVALCDADVYGPSIPIMFGLQGEVPFVRKVGDRDVMVPIERHGVKLNSIGLLVPADQAVVWRGPMASKALQQLIFDTDWGATDYLLIDMPPGLLGTPDQEKCTHVRGAIEVFQLRRMHEEKPGRQAPPLAQILQIHRHGNVLGGNGSRIPVRVAVGDIERMIAQIGLSGRGVQGFHLVPDLQQLLQAQPAAQPFEAPLGMRNAI
jgi:metal-sulfur cluster biosynthetic enzyme